MCISSLLQGHVVESTARLEPPDLVLVVGVVQLELVHGTILMVQSAGEGNPGCELGQAQDGHLVSWLHLLVVGRICEDQGKHTLFLEVGLVDAREGSHDDGPSAEMARFERGMLPGAAFAVVLVADNHPSDSWRWSLL